MLLIPKKKISSCLSLWLWSLSVLSSYFSNQHLCVFFPCCLSDFKAVLQKHSQSFLLKARFCDDVHRALRRVNASEVFCFWILSCLYCLFASLFCILFLSIAYTLLILYSLYLAFFFFFFCQGLFLFWPRPKACRLFDNVEHQWELTFVFGTAFKLAAWWTGHKQRTLLMCLLLFHRSPLCYSIDL